MTFELDKDFQYPRYSEVCSLCKHLDQKAAAKKLMKCAAFTEGIPDKIWLGENNHKNSYPGDNGIRFERMEL